MSENRELTESELDRVESRLSVSDEGLAALISEIRRWREFDRLTFREIEIRVIERRIAQFEGFQETGRKALAAESLGVCLKTLYNKLNENALRSVR